MGGIKGYCRLCNLHVETQKSGIIAILSLQTTLTAKTKTAIHTACDRHAGKSSRNKVQNLRKKRKSKANLPIVEICKQDQIYARIKVENAPSELDLLKNIGKQFANFSRLTE
jgi:hypothetical protein